MATDPLRLERRAAQRFEVHLPISIHTDDRTVSGFSQNVSARGVFLYTEAELPEGAAVELTFTMPAEITLAESMRVRCLGRVLRSRTSGRDQRSGIAVHLDSYHYLTECQSAPESIRVSSKDSHRQPPRAVPR